MKTLPEIASSGASIGVVVELMAKQIEKRLQALEQGGKATYVSAVETSLSAMMLEMAKVKTTVNVAAAAPVINVEPMVTVMEKEDKKEKERFSMSFERNLSGQIESATIVKTKD